MFCLKKLSIVPLFSLVVACTNTGASYQPVIDGPVGPNYSFDLAQCQQLAASQPVVNSGTAGKTAAGAGVGAATGLIVGDSSDALLKGAAVGAVAGLASSAYENNAQREVIIRNCMRGRGYKVVG